MTAAGGATDGAGRALVVFHGHGRRWWQRALKPGFRHCFAAIERDGYWILFDPRPGRPELRVVAGATFDLAAFYRAAGFAVVELGPGGLSPAAAPRPAPLPLMPATCVAAVKYALGLRAPLVLTPWQLWRWLGGEGERPADR